MSTARRPYNNRRPSGGGPLPQPNNNINNNGPRPAPAAAAVPAEPAKPGQLRKPVFTTVDQLLPQTQGHTLTARVVSARTVLDKGPAAPSHLRRTRVAECLVGDHTGSVLFTARNNQIEMLKPGNTVIFRNARIDMFKGTMRLAVDKWGRIEVIEDPIGFKVNEDNNVSKVEYELVDVSDKHD
ncbi:uncharacterized protein At4g28440 [Brachypodium distachyon]|uniref:Single-stranded DNA binding protein Ssb-like OB fold domain-containing protein n=1 Tax=Brachypodium distachyon TaxID=15368 RepID=I1H235_BRADI|nr:uncharacterized protein At4g28440 [Brachypodium distachyon]KQK20078.1 hypothetical protein BRADI_1g52310v3 [Brachypodium distachyon]|eukprot:XP_003557284.1 uncharacterized protein At4g28440 [Brachypodium distachyon]